MNARELYRRATALGLHLEPRGDKLAVIHGRLCPAEFADELRKNKAGLLALLKVDAKTLPDDIDAWLHIAKQVLAGEFVGADNATIKSLTVGLRNINHKRCREALASLPDNREKPRR